jgi:hypothetical protein
MSLADVSIVASFTAGGAAAIASSVPQHMQCLVTTCANIKLDVFFPNGSSTHELQ